MLTQLTRTPIVIGIFLLSILVIVLSHRTSGPPLMSPWLPQSALSISAAAPSAANSIAVANGSAQTLVAVAVPSMRSVPLSLAGDVGFNVRSALNARNGALRDVTIRPGETWSFNASIGNPDQVPMRTIGGVPGGGWCDLASRYVQAVRPLLPAQAIQFVNHVASNGIRIADVADADAVSIWNIDGRAGSGGQSQDLQITNTLAVPLHLQVVFQPDEHIVVQASTGVA